MITSDTPISRLFTPGQLECLARTAAEVVHGGAVDDSDLSRRQIILARRAYDALMDEYEGGRPQPPASPAALHADAAQLDTEIGELLRTWDAAEEADTTLGAEIEETGRRLMTLAGQLADAIAPADPRRERQLLGFWAQLAEAVDYYAALDEHDTAASADIADRLRPGITLIGHVLQAHDNLSPGTPGTAPTPAPECVILLANGATIRTDPFDRNPAGSSYVRVCAPGGSETGYWTDTEWAEEPQDVMGAILGAANSGRPARHRAPGRPAGSRRPAAAAPGTGSGVSDEQLTEWITAALEADGCDPDDPDDGRAPDLDDIVALAASVLNERGAAHPIGTMALWPALDGTPNALITVDQPGQHRVCLLPAGDGSFPGGTVRQDLADLLDAARTATACLDSAGEGDAAGTGGHLPEAGTVLTYGDEDSAWLTLGDLVHDAFSRRASDLDNTGLLAQIVYLVQELGVARTQAALAEPA